MTGGEPMQTPATGRPEKRGEDSRLLTGRGLFLNDRSSPDTAHAAFVRSPHAHALILSVDAAAARAVTGVLGVLTGEDYPADGLGLLGCGEGAVRRDGSAMWVPPRPALPADRARHAGEAVAMVVAGTEAIARDAAELVRVDYRPLDAVADTARAQDPATPLVWENCPGNEAFVAGAGDPPGFDRVRAEAAHVVQQRLTNQRVSANSIEPRGAFGTSTPFPAVSPSMPASTARICCGTSWRRTSSGCRPRASASSPAISGAASACAAQPIPSSSWCCGRRAGWRGRSSGSRPAAKAWSATITGAMRSAMPVWRSIPTDGFWVCASR